MSKFPIEHKNGSPVDAAGCVSKAVRIRNRLGHIMWPSIPRTTLVFSDNEVTANLEEVDPSQKGDIYVFKFFKEVKPNYG